MKYSWFWLACSIARKSVLLSLSPKVKSECLHALECCSLTTAPNTVSKVAPGSQVSGLPGRWASNAHTMHLCGKIGFGMGTLLNTGNANSHRPHSISRSWAESRKAFCQQSWQSIAKWGLWCGICKGRSALFAIAHQYLTTHNSCPLVHFCNT